MNLMAYLDHGYMVYPSKESKKNNIRLMNQQGVFYICGVKFVKPITSEMRLETRAGDNEFICHSVQVPNLERWGLLRNIFFQIKNKTFRSCRVITKYRNMYRSLAQNIK